MLKIIALMKKRPDMSVDQFRSHYETSHVPLITDLALPFACGYSRSYLDYDDPACIFGDGTGVKGIFPAFDVMTQLDFPNRQAMLDYFAAGREPSVKARRVADEERFLDRQKRLILATENIRISEL